ncbi:3-dehydroquinate synthase [Bacillota bacterium LX-D]|nr:3-dehydroquinate synthase [Bacillota bacterium LX-D]
MQKLMVDLKEKSYPIYIGKNLLGKIGEILLDYSLSKNCLVISNNTVFSLYGEKLITSLQNYGFNPRIALVEDGEGAKALSWANTLYNQAIDASLDRLSPIIALGGGVVGDLAGFIAATYLRGIPFIQVPTTLLAQVDSSVGGKVAINHPRGKNLIGSFYQPKLVVTDLTTLVTLPEREVKAGMAEIIKYGVIWDGEFYQYIKNNWNGVFRFDFEILKNIVTHSCKIKAEIIGKDELENEVRIILNFGHTIGHALETLTGYTKYRHGEAVAVGMVIAANIALQKGLVTEIVKNDIAEFINSIGLPTEIPSELKPEKIVECVHHDKKMKNGLIQLILPQKLGKAISMNLKPEEILLYLS